jgi:HSP20 family protein
MPNAGDPFAEIEQLFEQFTGPMTTEIAVDVVETDDEIVVLADVPGRDPDDIDVRLENDRVVHIDAPEASEDIDGQYVVRGRTQGSASRSVTLPAAVDEETTEATYDRGVLTVRLGKPAGGDGTDIPVN